MNTLMKALYLHFYAKTDKKLEADIKKYLGNSARAPAGSIESLLRYPNTRDFISKYVVFGSNLYFRFLELKSKDAREEWGREAVYHSRNIKNVRRK